MLLRGWIFYFLYNMVRIVYFMVEMLYTFLAVYEVNSNLKQLYLPKLDITFLRWRERFKMCSCLIPLSKFNSFWAFDVCFVLYYYYYYYSNPFHENNSAVYLLLNGRFFMGSTGEYKLEINMQFFLPFHISSVTALSNLFRS